MNMVLSVNLKKTGMQNWLKRNDWRNKNEDTGKKRLMLISLDVNHVSYAYRKEECTSKEKHCLRRRKHQKKLLPEHLHKVTLTIWFRQSLAYCMTVATSMIQQNEVPITLFVHISNKSAAEIETTFMPWLMEQATNALQKKIVARMLIDGKYITMCCEYIVILVLSHDKGGC